MAHTLGIFNNQFIDWLCIDKPYLNLRHELNINRSDLASILRISPHTIRRYETDNKAPHWYLMMLRVLCGDLSLFGNLWSNYRIQRHDRRLKGPHISNPLFPAELTQMYNKHALYNAKELSTERAKANKALDNIEALKKINNELMARIDLLEFENTRLKSEKAGIKSGKVIPLFGS